MAKHHQCGLDTDSKTMNIIGDSVEYPHRQQSVGHNDSTVDDRDSDSECWDDAKALLHTDDQSTDNAICDEPDDGRLRKQANRSQYEQKLAPSFDTVDGLVTVHQPASASSDYSSIQTNSKTTAAKLQSTEAAATTVANISPSSCHSTSDDELILHKAIFNNDTEKIYSILNDAELVQQRDLVNKRDKHGNTALHLACIMGRSKEIIGALLQNKHGFKWNIDVKNLNRWTPFHEACSYGNREVITLMAKQLKDDVDDALHNSKLSDFLEKTKDYRLVLKWEFQSWVPFVSRVLPSDVCVIVKQGAYVRIDTRLLDFEGLFKKKGDSCLVYSNKKWIVMNNKTKKYQYFETPSVYKDIDDKVDEFMASDIMDLELKSSEMQLTRSTSGWIWKADKVGKVGRFNAALYDLNNVFLVTRKRREHLSEDDLKRNKTAYRSAVHVFKFGEKSGHQREASDDNNQITDEENGNQSQGDGNQADGDNSDEDDEDEVIHRESLPPPAPAAVTWQDYLQSEPCNYPNLGREQKCKVMKTAVKASVAMSEEFPLSKKEFLDLLSIVPIKLFKKLKEFVEMKLPDGFPVRLDIPVFPFLTARITFEDFAFHNGPIDESLFIIPEDYEQDSHLLPGRLKNNGNGNGSSSATTNE